MTVATLAKVGEQRCIFLILMRTNISTIRGQDPILGIASVDKGGAPNVLGAARDLCLQTFYCLAANYFLFYVVPVDGSPGEKKNIYRQQFL